jgi:hypothetical protein
MDFEPMIGFFIMDSSGGLWAAVFIRAERPVLLQSRLRSYSRERQVPGLFRTSKINFPAPHLDNWSKPKSGGYDAPHTASPQEHRFY